MGNIIITAGNAGFQIAKAVTASTLLNDVTIYSIDSVIANVSLDTINRIHYKSILSDDKQGSGRSRTRGYEMYKFHEELGEFDDMYETAANAKSPVLVITSAAGGTGSGSSVPICKALIDRGIQVIPIIICPNMADPDAYHLNTNDLMLELDEIGVQTYCIFRNSRGDADYTPVNNEVVQLIEIIFGKRYDATDLDSIDDSDLDVVLNTPGRFIAVSATAQDVPTLKKELTRKVLSGYQPSWTPEESNNSTFMTAYSLTAMFAKQDFKTVFEDVNNRIVNVYDEYRNICEKDNSGKMTATLIVAGLPRAEIKDIHSEYKESNTIGHGMNKSKRPAFLNRKKASVTKPEAGDKNATAKFNWT